jgi:hypothetical protein
MTEPRTRNAHPIDDQTRAGVHGTGLLAGAGHIVALSRIASSRRLRASAASPPAVAW